MATDLTFNIAWMTKNAETLDKIAVSLERIGVRLDDLDHKKAEPKISVDTTAANAKIDELQAKLKGVGGGGGAGGGIGTGGLIGGALGLGAGPIVGASLLALPLAITAIGIAAEHTNPQVVTAFSNLTTAAKQTAQQGFSPLVSPLVQFANQAQSSLGAVRVGLSENAAAAAPLVSIIGTDFLKAAQQGIGASVPIVQGLRPVAQALGDDLVKLEHGVMGLFGNLQPGPAAQGLAELGTEVGALLPQVGTLINDVVPLGNDLLNLVGPALNDTARDAHLLAVPLQAVGSVVGFLGPVIGATVPVVLALAGGSKLLTGSWTDFAGAGTKVKSVFQDANGEFDRGRSTLDSLAGAIGINTKSARDAASAAASETATRAEAQAVLDKQAVAEAEEAVAADASAKNKRALAGAQAEATASAEADAAAQRALAEAEGASLISLGPLGIALGAAGAAMALFGLSEQKATPPTQDLTTDLVKLAQAAPDAVQGIVAGNPALQELINKAAAAGVNVKEMIAAYRGGPQALQAFSDSLAQQHKALGDSMVGISEGANNIFYQVQNLSKAQEPTKVKALVDDVNSGASAYELYDSSLKKVINTYNNQNDVQSQLSTTIKTLTTQQQAENQVLAQQGGVVLPQVTQNWNALGVAIGKRSSDFDSATAGVKGMTDNLVSAGSAFFGAQANFGQLDAAVVSAGQALEQAGVGVVNAEHAVAQASQGVATARASERQAIAAVTTAQDQLAKADQTEAQSVVNLNVARQQQIQTLKDLQRQVIDQADTQASAQLQLLDAQIAVKNAGLNGKTLADLGAPTAANEANYKLLLALQQAQHGVNDATAQGAQLAAQNAAAQAAGVDGAASVVTAQQAIVQAQQQAQQAAQALVQAKQGVTQASQGVANAQWAERQASAAVGQASAAQHAAALALTVAKDADSRSTDLNSASGVRNFQTIEQLFEANKKATGDIGLATAATEAQGAQMLISKDAVDGVITSLTKVPATTPFAIVGTPSLNLTALIQQASAQGISPFSLGLPSGDVQLAMDTLHGKASGGLITGPGSGTSDSILAATDDGGLLRVSNGEFIVRESQASKNRGLLEAINAGHFPGLAAGGPIDAKSLLGLNYRLAGWDGFLQGVSSTLQVFGAHTPNLPPPSTAPIIGLPGGGGLSHVSGNRAVNKAIMQRVYTGFGWGSGPEWAAQDYVEMREAGYDNFAQNPTSSAFGMGQLLDPTWAGTGIAKTIDPALQSTAMAIYERNRYRDPIGAAAHEAADNWYARGGLVALKPPKSFDSGGTLDPGLNLTWNGTGAPEDLRRVGQQDLLLAELRNIVARLDKLAPINVHPPAGASVQQVADAVLRRLDFRGR